MDKKERFIKQLQIAKRAMVKGLTRGDMITVAMDIELADDIFNLRLDDLLSADEFNFAHDICGIQTHINRRLKCFEDCFVPRYAGKKL